MSKTKIKSKAVAVPENDQFQCSICNRILDIEDSIRSADKTDRDLICADCHEKQQAQMHLRDKRHKADCAYQRINATKGECDCGYFKLPAEPTQLHAYRITETCLYEVTAPTEKQAEKVFLAASGDEKDRLMFVEVEDRQIERITLEEAAPQIVEDDKAKAYFVVEYANGMRQQVKRQTGDKFGCANLDEYALKLAQVWNSADKLAEALREMVNTNKHVRTNIEFRALSALAAWEGAQ